MSNNNQRKMAVKARGFTIVELLMVIVVIAILATITIVAYTGITEQAQDVKMVTAARQLEDGLRISQVTGGGSGILAKSPTGTPPTDRQQFFEFNTTQQLGPTACLTFRVDYGSDENAFDDGVGCFPVLTTGLVPKYDKKKLYVNALYGGAYTDSVSYSYWSNKASSWILKEITVYANGQEQVRDYTAANRSSLRCDPLGWDYEYPHSDCRYDPIPL